MGLIYLFLSFAYQIKQCSTVSPAINIHHCLAVHTKELNCHQTASLLLCESRKDVNSSTKLTKKHSSPHTLSHIDRVGDFHFLPICSVLIEMYVHHLECEGSKSSIENRGYTGSVRVCAGVLHESHCSAASAPCEIHIQCLKSLFSLRSSLFPLFPYSD